MPETLGLTLIYCPEMFSMDLLLKIGSPKPKLTPYSRVPSLPSILV